jgi:hypothetical protein
MIAIRSILEFALHECQDDLALLGGANEQSHLGGGYE